MGRIASFEGLACLVTGASSGIGREIARELARRKARVVVTARRAERLQELVGELTALGAPAAWAVTADLARTEEVERLAAEAERLAGPIDVLVSNAGFAVAGLFVRSDSEEPAMVCWKPLALAHRLLPGMIERGRGGVLIV
jgi:short-subunit dehydrogenase